MTTKTTALAIASAALIAFAMSCGTDDGGDPPVGADTGVGCGTEPTFTSIHSTILAGARCASAGCHGAAAQGGLSLDGGKDAVYAELTTEGTADTGAVGNFPNRIVANDPAASFAYLKVAEANPPGNGDRMPLGAPALDACEIAAMSQWINNGAAND